MYERLLARALASTSRSVLLLGPRQVGKSTLLASLRPDLTLNLASPAAFRDYVSRPEQLEHELEAAPAATKTVFIDEVQRVPALLNVAQVFLDRRPPRFRFLLSGSRSPPGAATVSTQTFRGRSATGPDRQSRHLPRFGRPV